MGERISASIQFAGKLSSADAEKLVKLVNDEGLDPDWGDSGDITIEDLDKVLGDYEVNYGNLDTLQEWAGNHNLAYLQWYDQSSEWNQGFYKRDLAGRYENLDGTPENPLFSAKMIKELGIDKIRELVEWVQAPLGVLEITP
jgi:hypothetical protein